MPRKYHTLSVFQGHDYFRSKYKKTWEYCGRKEGWGVQSEPKGVTGLSWLILVVLGGYIMEIHMKLSFISSAAQRRTYFIKLFVGSVRLGNDWSYSENMLLWFLWGCAVVLIEIATLSHDKLRPKSIPTLCCLRSSQHPLGFFDSRTQFFLKGWLFCCAHATKMELHWLNRAFVSSSLACVRRMLLYSYVKAYTYLDGNQHALVDEALAACVSLRSLKNQFSPDSKQWTADTFSSARAQKYQSSHLSPITGNTQGLDSSGDGCVFIVNNLMGAWWCPTQPFLPCDSFAIWNVVSFNDIIILYVFS